MKHKTKHRRLVDMALAVLIAFGMWFYVINVENPTGSANLRDLPVELQGVAELTERDLMVTELSEETIDLKVTGRKKTLMKLDKKNVSLAADVSHITEPGAYELTCRAVFPSHVNTDNVSVARWSEMVVTAIVEERGTKNIPVRGQFVGTEAQGCLAGAVSTDPQVLELTGPQDSLEKISYAQVQVGGEEISDTIVESAPVVFMDRNGVPVEDLTGITSSASQVEITIPVRQVAKIPLTVSFRAGGGAEEKDVTYEITPSSVTVVAEDTADLPESISLGEIDLSQVYGDTSYAMPVPIPDGLTGWGAPSYASVHITLGGLESRQIATGKIHLAHVPEGYNAVLASPRLHVWVRGEPELVKEMTADDVAVEVDLSRASLGDELQRFPAQVSLVGGDLKGVGVVGTHYSVAVRLSPAGR